MTEHVKGLIFDIDVDPRTGTAQLRAVSDQFRGAVGSMSAESSKTESTLGKLHGTIRNVVTGFGALMIIREVAHAMHFLSQSGDQFENSLTIVKSTLGGVADKFAQLFGFKDAASGLAFVMVTLAEAAVAAGAAVELLARKIGAMYEEFRKAHPFIAKYTDDLLAIPKALYEITNAEAGMTSSFLAKNAPWFGEAMAKLDKLRNDLMSGKTIPGQAKPYEPELWNPDPVPEWVALGAKILGVQERVKELNAGFERMQELIDPITQPEQYDAMMNGFIAMKKQLEDLGGKGFVFDGMDSKVKELTQSQKAYKQAIEQSADAFGQYAAAMITAKIAGGDFSGTLGDMLAQLAQQMLAMSLSSAALGLFASTTWGGAILGDPAEYFAAAAAFGVAGLALAAASRAAGGPTSSASSGGGGSTSSAVNQAERPQDIRIFIEGQGFVQNTEEFARVVGRQISKQASRGGRF